MDCAQLGSKRRARSRREAPPAGRREQGGLLAFPHAMMKLNRDQSVVLLKTHANRLTRGYSSKGVRERRQGLMVKKGIWKNAGKLRSRRSGGTGCFVIRRSAPDGAGRSLLACGLLFYLGYAADAFVGIKGCRVALPAFAGVADWSAKLRRLWHPPEVRSRLRLPNGLGG